MPAGVSFIALASMVVMLLACGDGEASGRSKQEQEITESVRLHIKRGRIKVEEKYTTTETQEFRVGCTQYDRDLYPNRCSGTGGTFGFGYKTERREVPVTRTRTVEKPCPEPPTEGDPAWRVSGTGKDAWVVSNGRGQWRVEKVGGKYRVDGAPC